jgi:hypothetical protein
MKKVADARFRIIGLTIVLVVGTSLGQGWSVTPPYIYSNPAADNVGIGTSTPGARLFIEAASGNTFNLSRTTVSNNPAAADWIHWSAVWGPNSGGIRAGGSWGWDTQLYGDQSLSFSGNGYTAAAPDMVIRSHSVGIGTTSPADRLDVYSGGGTYIAGTRSDNFWTGYTLNSSSNMYNYYFPIANVHIPSQYQYGSAEITISNAGAAAQKSDYNAVIQLQVKQQAAMGSAPIISVQVSSSLGFNPANIIFVLTTNSSSSTAGTLYVKNVIAYEEVYYTFIGASGYIVPAASGTAGVASLPTGTQYPGQQGLYTYNGNVGIGTTNPGSPLEIDNSTVNQPDLIISQNNTAAGNYYANILLKNSAGVIGNLSALGTAYNINNNVWGPSDLALLTGQGLSSSNLILATNSSGAIKFATGGYAATNERMRITSSGAVAIGTTSPGTYMLAVKGKIGAKEVVVTQTGWSDYVFKDDYNLKPLEKVAEYVKKNKHLEGIPTQADVKKNGVAVGDMQAKLLRKVEELTLYTIAMKKENDELRARMSELEKRIRAK